MKQILYVILKMALLFPLLTACSNEIDFFLSDEVTEDNAIVLEFSAGDTPQSRAIEATGSEVMVKHLDVFIFETDGNRVYYERITNCTDRHGTATLAAKREMFTEGEYYWVYLIANSTFATTDFEIITDLNSLKAMTQKDPNIFLTGISNITEAPKSFLMDGIAYEATFGQEPAATPVVLYNGIKSDNTELKVVLRRAAAKIIVQINKGNEVTFDKELAGAIPEYYLRNMPYTTSLLAGVDGEAELLTPNASPISDYFQWTSEQITVTSYAYAHEWADASLEKEVRLVVNIPMTYKDKNGNITNHASSYYQIPLSKDKVLKRNTCYKVTVTVNAPGALDPSEPEELKDIQYSVVPWKSITVNIDGDERPIFLYVNEEEMEMHNIAEDNSTLYFTSSSEVTATIENVYFYNKFGLRQELEEIPNTDNEYGINEGTANRPNWSNRCTIKITPDSGIYGIIDVYSTIPDNNTIRYIDIIIKNNDGIERKVTIVQYPLTYITNIEGYYSYRDDFVSTASDGTSGVTTWELLAGKKINKGTAYTSQQVPYNSSNAWICGCSWNSNGRTWSYGKTTTSFFASKIATNFNESTGLSNIEYARWTEVRNGRRPYTYTYNTSTSYVSSLNNHRMYHVVITASSAEYTLGRPRITDGKTDPGADNAQLVSPSFMLASQLGAVMPIQDLDGAAQHCERYVEVARDGTVYDDWRLPTAAEINIIYKYQNDSDAMDQVLSGDRYWSASGLVPKPGVSNPSGQAIRCIRDAY